MILYSPFAIIAYGSNLQEIVLMNLELSEAAVVVKLAYVLCMIFTFGMNILPMIDIYNNLRESVLKETKNNLG